MDRRFPLEALLLSRSYESNEKIIDLLQTRYLSSNDRFPELHLIPTSVQTPQPDKKSILKKIKEKKTKSKDTTRNSLKLYIKQCQETQAFLKKQLNSFQDKSKGLKLISKSKKKNLPRYEDFLNLNMLWINYIQELLQIETLQRTKYSHSQQQQILNKLASADFNGCFLNVLKSSDKNIIGKSGIVIWDSKNFFIIVQDSKIDPLKLLPKKNTVFNFVIPLFNIDNDNEESEEKEEDKKKHNNNNNSQDNNKSKNEDEYLEFSIIGSRFQFKSSDRARKKFKSRNVDDLDL